MKSTTEKNPKHEDVRKRVVYVHYEHLRILLIMNYRGDRLHRTVRTSFEQEHFLKVSNI